MKRLTALVLLIILAVSTSGCQLIEQLKCEHQYEITEQVQPTCEMDGERRKTCSLCAKIITEPILALGHNYGQEEVIQPTCTEQGYSTAVCSRCEGISKSEITSPLGHNYGEWTTVVTPSEVKEGLKERGCTRCTVKESAYIATTSYVDLSVIKEDFDQSLTYTVENYQQLLLKFQTALIYLADTLKIQLNYTENNQGLAQRLVDDSTALYGYSINTNRLGNLLTVNFTHNPPPSKSSTTIHYTQYESLNYTPTTSSREDSFNQFNIEESIYSFQVKTTEQLFYALERGAKPIVELGSKAETVYAKLKTILKEIIDDSMNDYQKIRAIHDYLIMNVTYDKSVLLLLQNGETNLNDYYSFYIDGVLDELAVCEGISKTFSALCNIEGIPCVVVSGRQTGNANGVGHAWNKVYADGRWYIVDVTSDGTIISDTYEVLSYEFFMISEEKFLSTYTANNFTNIICQSNYNPFENSTFTYKGEVYDFKITSQQELDKIVGYFESFDKTNLTIQFEIAFDYGDAVTDEISKAYQNNMIFKGYNYLSNGNIFMLVK